MLFKRTIMAVPLAIGWTIYTSQPTIGNFLLGFVFSYIVLIAVRVQGDTFRVSNIPRQVLTVILYLLFLSREVLLAGFNVARIILSPNMNIKPGIAKVNTLDKTENPLVSAISAHGITITPGELVIDFEETEEDGVLMIVHSLNIEQSEPLLDADQTVRLNRIKGMLGYD